MSKKSFLGLSILLIVFLLLGVFTLGGCDTTTPPIDDDDKNGVPDPGPEPQIKVLNVALSRYPLTLDFQNYSHRDTQNLHRMFSDGLMWAKPDGVHVYDVAESITRLDEITYEIKVREDVYFHNGDHMTADDVAFTITRMGTAGGLEGETARRRSLAGPIESVEITGDYTVVVTLERPNHLLQIRNWYHFDILPKKYFDEVGIEGFMKHPITLGPFKWVEGDLMSHVVLERFEDYYGGCPEIQGEVDRIPVVDRVVVRFIPDATTRIAAIMAGDVDIIQGVPFDAVQMLLNHPDVEVVAPFVATNVAELHINTTKAPFDDKRVRQAIAYAIDYDLLCEVLLMGYSSPLYGRPVIDPFGGEPGHGQFNHLQAYEYNPEKARALLEEAGVSGLSLIIDTVMESVNEAQAIAQMLSDIGMDASVRVWEFGVLLEEFKKGHRDLYYNFRGFARRSPQGVRHSVNKGSQYYLCGYDNQTVIDSLLAGEAMEDETERNKLFIEAFEILIDEVPVIWVHEPLVFDAHRSNIKNYYACTMGRMNLHRVDIE